MENNNGPIKVAKGAIKLLKIKLLKYVILFLVVIFGIFLIAGFNSELKTDAAAYKEDEESNVSYAVQTSLAETKINSNKSSDLDSTGSEKDSKEGDSEEEETYEFELEKSPNELWEELVKNKSPITKYLKNSEELSKLMHAQSITQYMDLRENPDEEIDWETIFEDVDSTKIQGIVKMKRADSEGNEKRMTYVDVDTFYDWLEYYNETGDQATKEKLMTHFTIEPSSGIGGGNYSVYDVTTEISDAIVAATETVPSAGAGYCQSWVRQVYAAAGLGQGYFADAFEAYRHNKVSEDWSSIPVGAAVYGTGSGSGHGHVGIYIGNGMVRDNVGAIKTQTLEDWIAWQEKKGGKFTESDGRVRSGWLGWGWQSGVANTASYTAEVLDTSSGGSSTITGNSFQWPTIGTNISSPFGMRTHPIDGTQKMHNGVDIAVSEGTDVYATTSGTVERVEDNGSTGYGKCIYITHDNGYKSIYGHLSDNSRC